MSVDITGGDGSLFWKAGVDTSDLESGMQKVTDIIQLNIKKQVDLQQQAASSSKQMAQTILQSASSLSGLDRSLGGQAGGMASFGASLKTLSSQISQYIASIEAQMAGLEGESIDIKGRVDSKPLLDALTLLKSEISVINSDTISIHAEAVDVQPLLKALDTVQAEYDKFSQKSLTLKVSADVSGLNGLSNTVSQTSLDAFKTHREDIIGAISAFKNYQAAATGAATTIGQAMDSMADHSHHALHGMEEDLKSVGTEGRRSVVSLQQMANAVKGQAVTWQQLNTAFHGIFHGKSGDASLGAQWQQIKSGNLSLSEFIANLKLTDKQLAGLPEKLEKAGIVAKGAFANMASLSTSIEVDVKPIDKSGVDKVIGDLQRQLNTLEATSIELKTKGLDTTQVDQDIANLKEKLKIPPVVVPPPAKTGSINEITQELQKLKESYASLSEVDRNSEIGRGMAANITDLEKRLESINKAFLRVEQHAAGSINDKVAQLSRLKDEYSALSEIDRRSTAGRQMAQNIHNLDRDIQHVNGELQQTESLMKRAGVAIGAYLSFQAASNFVQDVVRVRAEFQRLEAVLTNSIGADAAKSKMQELTEFAARTPFQLDNLTNSYVKLVNQGINPTMDQLTAMGDLASSTGKDFDQLTEAVLDAQTGEFERLKEFGVRAVKDGDNIKFTFKGIETQVKFTSEAIQNYIFGLGKMEGVTGSMAAISKTLGGALSNLEDSWNAMLNEIGQSSEGVFSTAIDAANSLIKNYETVLEVLGSLVAAYGTYRAALLAEVALQRIVKTEAVATALAKKGIAVAEGAVTSAQILQTGATTVLRGAWQSLNLTMKANPMLFVAGAVGALVFAIMKLRNATSEVKTSQELFANAQQQIADRFAETRAKIEPYVEALKNANLSEEERLRIYNELRKIDPDIVKGIDAKTISYEKLKDNVDKYLDSVREQIRLETNRGALTESVKQEEKLASDIERINKRISQSMLELGKTPKTDTEARGLIQFNISTLAKDKKALEEALRQQREISKKFGTAIVPEVTAPGKGKAKTLADYLADQTNLLTKYSEYIKLVQNKSDLDAVKKALTDRMEALAPSDKAKESYKKKIAEINELLKRYGIESPTKAAKAQETQESKVNALLEQRRELLQAINELRAGADKSTQTKEESEVEKINKRYDEVLEKIEKFNSKVAAFNKKNGTSVQPMGMLEIAAVNDSRIKEIGSEVLGKQGVDLLKTDLENVREVFTKYSEAVKSVGAEKANEIYGEQTKGFQSFLEYLQSEASSNANRVNPTKMGVLTKAIADEQKRQDSAAIDQQMETFKQLLSEVKTYKQQEYAINLHYDTLLNSLEQNRGLFTKEDYDKRKEALKTAREGELQDLKAAIAKQAPIFRQLNADLFTFSKADIQKRVKDLKGQLAEALKTGKIKDAEGNLIDLTPKMVEEIKNGIQNAEDEAKKLGTVVGLTASELGKIAEKAQKVAGLFAAMAEAVRPLNENLADSFSQLSDMANMAGSIASAAGSFASGDYLSGATQSVQVIGNIVKVFTDAKLSAQQAQQAIRDFNDRLLVGGLEYNQALRQRNLLQAQSNKLTLEGLTAQKEALDVAKKQNGEEYDRVLKLLQQEEFIAGQHTEKGKGSSMFGAVGYLLGIGAKTSAVNDMASLAGKSFDQLEQLFNNGQLTDRAKELFQQLQKLKQEGVDIDKQLQDLKDRATEVFTGTTAESLTNDLAQMFKQGKTSAQDFADFFREKMQGALINALQFQAIEPFIKDFMQQFSDAAQSDGALTAQEIDDLKRIYTAGTEKFREQFDQLQQISGLNFNGLQGGAGNSLQGAIKGITETQAELLAGQFGGLRLTALDQLKVAQQGLQSLIAIQANTALTVNRLETQIDKTQDMLRMWQDFSTGAKKVHIT